ncbi:MAG: CcmD family protein [Clostridia bacterium]|nr:CcmD family protein [Clostridia bacterium]
MGYLFAAYSVIWIVIFGYVFSIGQRQKQLEREVEALQLSLKDRGI